MVFLLQDHISIFHLQGTTKKVLASNLAGQLPVKLPRISQWSSTFDMETAYFSDSKPHGATSEKPVFYNGIQYCTSLYLCGTS